MEVFGKDAAGAELHKDCRVHDIMFGLGTVKGKVAINGGGFNILVDWDK